MKTISESEKRKSACRVISGVDSRAAEANGGSAASDGREPASG